MQSADDGRKCVKCVKFVPNMQHSLTVMPNTPHMWAGVAGRGVAVGRSGEVVCFWAQIPRRRISGASTSK